MEWKPVKSRIIIARLKGRQTNVSIIQCYAPINDRVCRDLVTTLHAQRFPLVPPNLVVKSPGATLNLSAVRLGQETQKSPFSLTFGPNNLVDRLQMEGN